MSVRAMDGKALAAVIRAEVAERAAKLTANGTTPRLVLVGATADQASAWYARSTARASAKVGISCDLADLGPDATSQAVHETLARLSADETVHGIVLRTPLPGGATLAERASAIDPSKDVDGASPRSLGRLMGGLPAFAPATADAVLALLDHHQVALEGRHVVVVGRSIVVGKPVAHLLLDRNATVTICHSRTRDLTSVTSAADVLVVAVGRARMLGAEHVRAGAVVVDVGTNPDPAGGAGLVGDVDAAAVGGKAGALTPVPGGIGPVTTALLLRHTITAATTTPTRSRS